MSRFAIRDAIIRLNPSYHHQRIVHLITTYEFPWLTKHALDQASLNIISALDVQTPAGKPDFYLSDLMLEVMSCGYSSSQGRAAVDKLDGLFTLWKLNRPQIIQVFATFTAELLHWYEKLGWRDLSEVGYEALLQFWCVVGGRLRHTPVSVTYNNMEDATRLYLETRHTIRPDRIMYIRRYPIWQRPAVYLFAGYMRKTDGSSNLVRTLIRGRRYLIHGVSKAQLKRLPLQIPKTTSQGG